MQVQSIMPLQIRKDAVVIVLLLSKLPDAPMGVLPVVEGFPQIVPGTLSGGHTLGLGGFGTMGLMAKSKPGGYENEFNAGLVEGLKVVFHPRKLSREEPEGTGLQQKRSGQS